jgi:hypothetical protein
MVALCSGQIQLPRHTQQEQSHGERTFKRRKRNKDNNNIRSAVLLKRRRIVPDTNLLPFRAVDVVLDHWATLTVCIEILTVGVATKMTTRWPSV